ncbi:MAG: phytoene/squalene synthase family protein [Vicingaceae bacterium]
MEALYRHTSLKCSKVVTNCYSTSFSLGIKALGKEVHDPIYAIYGFVRLADEIVDTFHQQDKETLLSEFKVETKNAIQRKLSLNPILNSFQWAVNKYNIEEELIDGFLKSMELDLEKKEYDEVGIKEYIYGSAEVVGLMSLRVFCEGDDKKYQELKAPAKRLGSALQKINFLRDLNEDFIKMGRSYFPNVDLNNFNEADKKKIEADILTDFLAGYKGIQGLPKNAKFGVYTAYKYYIALFEKIKGIKAERVMEKRIRISNRKKYWLLIKSYFECKFGMV